MQAPEAKLAATRAKAGPLAPQPRAPKDPNEACARILVTAYKGAAYARAEVVRSKQEAEARARKLLAEAQQAPDRLAELAQAHSDAPSSAARGGIMGTFTKDDWPELHGALKSCVFGLKAYELSNELVQAPYGYVIVQRCPVEKAHGRHILLRYRGAKRAGKRITRTKAAAKKRAGELHAKLLAGVGFETLARKHSEDSSAKRGGDVGLQGRGRLAKAFEEALFALKPGEISGVVETEFGFHLVQRLAP